MLKVSLRRDGGVHRIGSRLAGAVDVSDVLTSIGLVGVFVGLWLRAPWLALTIVGTVVTLIGLVVAVLRVRADLAAEAKQKRGGA